MTDEQYEAMLRRWKQGLEDLVTTVCGALEDNRFSPLEVVITATQGSSLGMMVRQDIMSMTADDRAGMLDYLERADLKVS